MQSRSTGRRHHNAGSLCRRHCCSISSQHQHQVTSVWMVLLLLCQALLTGAHGTAVSSSQQQQQHLISLQGLRWQSAAQITAPDAAAAADVQLVDYGMLTWEPAAGAAADQGSTVAAAADQSSTASAAPSSWEVTRQQALKRRQQFQQRMYQQQQQRRRQAVLPPTQLGAESLQDDAIIDPTDIAQIDILSGNVAPVSVKWSQQGSRIDNTAMGGSGLASVQYMISSVGPLGVAAPVTTASSIDQHAMASIQQSLHAPDAGANMVDNQDPYSFADAAQIESRHSSSIRTLAETTTTLSGQQQQQPSASDGGTTAASHGTTAARPPLQPVEATPPTLTADTTTVATGAGGGAASVVTGANAAGGTGVSSTAGNPAVHTDGSGSGSQLSAASPPWKPKVLEAPVPKWPRLYATVAPPAPTLAADLAPAAVAALLAAAREAKTPQGISISGIPGLTLEDKILLARLLGHVVPGTFDAAGQMDSSSTAYWEHLDAQIDKHTQVKHMFESIWYKCSKLNSDLLMRTSSAYDMEVEALQHILAWLGFPEKHLPRPGEYADFDDLVALLDGIGATARLVTDPVPFLQTTRPPFDRNGMPLLIHMTFKDKGQFARHHLLSLASWAKENPDHAILMYDDADLEAYLSTYDPSVLQLYGSLKTAVERSDLWRYVVMCKHGGVYTDADTLCVRPIQEWNKENHNDAEAVFGVEDVFKRDPNGGNSGWGVSQGRFGIQFEQWTLAGAPNHPVYCNMHSFISQRIIDEASKQSQAATTESENWSILHRTGPHVWTDSVLHWMHDQGIGFHEALTPGGRLVANNTRIMPGETFGCAAHFFSPAARLEEVYAMHMFRGVWRKRLDSGGGEADRHHIRLGF